MKQSRRWPETGAPLRFLSMLATIATAAPGHAQVIEIDDDGGIRVFSGPTRFVDVDIGSDTRTVAAPASVEDAPFDRVALSEAVDPRLLRAVAWAESRGEMAAISPKGALGIMQLMPATAAELGVDPHDRDANIRGGARYLARMLSQFGSVPLALAAYNAGPAAVVRWGGIPPYRETRAYVGSILSRWRGVPAFVTRRTAKPASDARIGIMLIEVP